MKNNNDCIRDILFTVEKIPYGETLTVEKVCELLPKYSNEDVIGMISILNREHFINIVDKVSYNEYDIFRENKIRGLTERGYRNLDIIKEDRIWNLIKEKLANFDDVSFFMISSIAAKIVNDEHNKLFGVDGGSVIDYSRW